VKKKKTTRQKRNKMKKLFALFAFCAVLTVNAQTVTPRYGTAKNQDNTGRVLTYGTATVTPTSTMVTIPAQTTFYKYVSVASVSISPTFTANVANSYKADQMDLLILGEATGTRTITLSTNIIANAATTQTLAASKQALFRFVFNGSKWVEVARSIEP
jgi:hypothetical protein